MSTAGVSPEVLAEIAAIDAAREDVFAELRRANAAGLTGAAVREIMDGFDDIERRTVELHKRVWPRHRGSLLIALGHASLMSPTGRNSRSIWSR